MTKQWDTKNKQWVSIRSKNKTTIAAHLKEVKEFDVEFHDLILGLTKIYYYDK